MYPATGNQALCAIKDERFGRWRRNRVNQNSLVSTVENMLVILTRNEEGEEAERTKKNTKVRSTTIRIVALAVCNLGQARGNWTEFAYGNPCGKYVHSQWIGRHVKRSKYYIHYFRSEFIIFFLLRLSFEHSLVWRTASPTILPKS